MRIIRTSSLVLCLALTTGACQQNEASRGFESPRATVDSLFRAYGVQSISQAEARRRLQARERFELLDANLFRSCFSNWQGEHDQALGGFVFGQLVAAKDELEIDLKRGSAEIRVAPGSSEVKPIVLVKQNEAWKIDLEQSVPPHIRQSLYEVYRRARRAERSAR